MNILKIFRRIVLVWLTAAVLSCSGGGADAPAPGQGAQLGFTNFQSASTIIGQPTTTSGEPNQGGTAGSKTVQYPWGNARVFAGTLYLPDYGNNRILGYYGIPVGNNAQADFVLGQKDFAATASSAAADGLSGPQTVKASGNRLVVDDMLNSRILIWNTAPVTTGIPADVVVGQAGFNAYATGCSSTLMNNPENIEVIGDKLIVADTYNHRILIWNHIPTANGTAADLVLGQNGFSACAPNDDNQDGVEDTHPTARTLSYPSGLWSDGTRFIVSEIGNNRVLIWNTFPANNFSPADIVLGQSDFAASVENDDNRDGVADAYPSARTLFFPRYLDSDGTRLFVADRLNNRILIWNAIPHEHFTPADVVLGQSDFAHWKWNDDDQNGGEDTSPSARTLYHPSGVTIYGNQLIVTDGQNSRYMIFESHN